ncbi:MAG: O-antigen ligase family protein [Roseateles sp.]
MRMAADFRSLAFKLLGGLALALLCLILGVMIAVLPVGVVLRGVALLGLLIALLLAWQVRSSKFGMPPRLLAWCLLGTVALSIIWPRFIFFPIGGAYTNPQAASVLLMLAACAVVLIANVGLSKRDSCSALGLWNLGWLIFAWFAWRVLCAFLGDYPAVSVVGIFKELAYSGSFVLLAMVLLGYPEADRWLLRTIVFCAFIAVVFGLVEAVLQKNPLIRFASGADNDATVASLRSLTTEKIREGAYRAQSLFTHPIVFAQFVAAVLPLSLLLVITEKKSWFWRALAGLVIPIGLAAIVKSGSRAGLVSVLAALGFMLFMFWLRAFRGRGFGRVAALVGGPALLIAVGGIGWMVKGLIMGRSAIEAGSTSARVEMLRRGVAALEQHPIFGYGEGLSVHVAGLTDSKGHTSVDSYLLSIAIDSGYPGLLLFLVIVLTFVSRLAWLAAGDAGPRGLSAAMVAASVMALFVSFVGLSIPHNMTLLWVLLVLGLLYAKRLQTPESTAVVR